MLLGPGGADEGPAVDDEDMLSDCLKSGLSALSLSNEGRGQYRESLEYSTWPPLALAHWHGRVIFGQSSSLYRGINQSPSQQY